MKYYDIVALPRVGAALAERLGYANVFSQGEVRVAERPSGDSAYMLRSSEPGFIFKAIGDRNCIGIIFKDNIPVKKTLEKAASEGKAVIIPMTEITCSSGPSLMRNTYRLRSVLAACRKAKTPVALVSLAGSDSALLSAMQMLELARFIGAEYEDAKEMLSHRWIQ